MRVWTVQVRPPAGRKPPRAVMLRDGFSIVALLFPLPWLLVKRLFALAAIYTAAMLVLGVTLPAGPAVALAAGVNLFIGFEARALQSWWLGLRGWRIEAIVMGRTADAAFITLSSSRPDLARVAV